MDAKERDTIIRSLTVALLELEKSLDDRLIPNDGMDFAYALPNARDIGDVAGVCGKIRLREELGTAKERIGFGGGGEAMRCVLTAMRFEPSLRSAATIRCTAEVLGVMESLFFSICEFDPGKVPPGIPVMEWGVAFCCREGVPDAIWNRGYGGIEPVVRLLAEDPQGVATNIIKVSARIRNRASES